MPHRGDLHHAKITIHGSEAFTEGFHLPTADRFRHVTSVDVLLGGHRQGDGTYGDGISGFLSATARWIDPDASVGSPAVVPLPAALPMFLGGLALFGLVRRRA